MFTGKYFSVPLSIFKIISVPIITSVTLFLLIQIFIKRNEKSRYTYSRKDTDLKELNLNFLVNINFELLKNWLMLHLIV
jgi:predicted ferric reductase